MAVKDGVTQTRISELSGVRRGTICNICNDKTVALEDGDMVKLSEWAKDYIGEIEETKPCRNAKEVQFIETKAVMQALGMCSYGLNHRKMIVVIGRPGTGKTTLAKRLHSSLPDSIYIEAWEMMRLSDLLKKMADGLGIEISGSMTERTMQIRKALSEGKQAIIIDEAEYLSKWDNSKLEVLRKLWDNTQAPMIFFGTHKFQRIIESADASQFGRRMYKVNLQAPEKQEMIESMLSTYAIEQEAAEELAKVAIETNLGGMGTWAELLEICLEMAGVGKITRELVRQAGAYKCLSLIKEV